MDECRDWVRPAKLYVVSMSSLKWVHVTRFLRCMWSRRRSSPNLPLPTGPLSQTMQISIHFIHTSYSYWHHRHRKPFGMQILHFLPQAASRVHCSKLKVLYSSKYSLVCCRYSIGCSTLDPSGKCPLAIPKLHCLFPVFICYLRWAVDRVHFCEKRWTLLKTLRYAPPPMSYCSLHRHADCFFFFIFFSYRHAARRVFVMTRPPGPSTWSSHSSGTVGILWRRRVSTCHANGSSEAAAVFSVV